MEKTVYSDSSLIIKEQKKLIRNNILVGVIIGVGIFLIYFLYVLLHSLGNGYFLFPNSIFGKVSGLAFIRYFDTNTNLFDFSKQSSLARFIFLVCIILVCILVSVVYIKLHYMKINAKFKKDYEQALISESKLNGLVLDLHVQLKEDELDENAKTLEYMSIYDSTFKDKTKISTSLVELNASSYVYKDENGFKKDGVLISTNLSKIRTHSFLEIRSNGQPSFDRYDGLKINKYGFDEISSIANFICYTTLGQEVYLIINKKVADSISKFSFFVKTDVIISLKEDKLNIFLEGFKFNFDSNLKDKLEPQILEKQAEALVGLQQVITKIVNGLNGEVSFTNEQSGNGILIY